MIFDIHKISSEFSIDIKGVIHVGGYTGGELPAYRSLGLANTILFEPQAHLASIIRQKCIGDERVFTLALGSEKKQVEMYVSDIAGGIMNGAGQSSSILKPKVHLTEHPNITFPEMAQVEVDLLDNVISNNDINQSQYNFLNIDVQGYELEVLKGASKTIDNIDAMILEINRSEMYEGCPMVEEIDEFLDAWNFKRAVTGWQSAGWGDALYVKVNE